MRLYRGYNMLTTKLQRKKRRKKKVMKKHDMLEENYIKKKICQLFSLEVAKTVQKVAATKQSTIHLIP